jgi:hypothetical protein
LLAKVSPSGITWLLALKLKVCCMVLIFVMAVSKATLAWLFSSWKKAAETEGSFGASGAAHSPMSNSMGWVLGQGYVIVGGEEDKPDHVLVDDLHDGNALERIIQALSQHLSAFMFV